MALPLVGESVNEWGRERRRRVLKIKWVDERWRRELSWRFLVLLIVFRERNCFHPF